MWRPPNRRLARLSRSMDNDYRRYEELRANGASADEAYRAAVREGRDWTYCIRMLRSTYDLSLIDARDVLLRNRS
jgi:hypothetical protein